MRLRFVWQINSRLYYMRYIYGTVKVQLSSNVYRYDRLTKYPGLRVGLLHLALLAENDTTRFHSNTAVLL